MTIDELQVLITANTNQLKKELNGVKSQLGGVEKSTGGMSNVMSGSFAKIAAAAVAVGLSVKGIWDATRNYGALEQNLGGAEAVFEQYSDSIKQMASESAEVMGTSTSQYLQTANKMGSLFQGTGASVANSFKMTTDSMQRAIDVASVMGVSVDMALESVAGMAKGNFTMMDNLGVAMNDTNIQAYLLEKGIQANVNTMTTATKVGYAYQMFMDRTAKYAGNFARESTTLEGALAIMKAQLSNAGAQLGYAFAPMVTSVAGLISSYLIPALQAVIPYVVAFMNAIGQAVAYVGGLIGKAFGIKTQSGVKGVADQAKNASKAVSGIGGGADNASKGLDGATGSAKKLKKEMQQLAGFDEMNVLQEQPDDAGGGGGGGAGGGAGGLGDLNPAMLDFVDPLAEIDNKAQEILKSFGKVGEFFKTLWNTAPVQAFASLVGAQLNFIWQLVSQLGTAIWNNMVGTWELIAPNVMGGLTNLVTFFTIFWTQLAEVTNTYTQPIVDGIVGLFNSIWADFIEPIAVIVSQIWFDMTKMLLDTWNKYGKGILDSLGQFYVNVIAIFQSIWDNVIAPIIQPFLEMLSELWDKHLKGMVAQFSDFVGKLVQFALDIFNNVISPIVKWLLENLKPAFAFIGQFISGVFGTVFGTIADVVGNIFKVLGGLIDFIAGVFTGNWSRAWDGIKNVFGGIFGGIVAIAKAPLNILIDLINSFIAGINAIKIPDWVPGVGGKNLNIPKIPKLAKGGIIDQATLAVVGESGREAVMPLENNTGWITELANKINAQLGGGGGQTIIVKVGEETLIRKVVDGINDMSYRNNEGVIEV